MSDKFYLLELMTGEKLKCTGCTKVMESEKTFIHINNDTDEVEEVFCEACHEEH